MNTIQKGKFKTEKQSGESEVMEIEDSDQSLRQTHDDEGLADNRIAKKRPRPQKDSPKVKRLRLKKEQNGDTALVTREGNGEECPKEKKAVARKRKIKDETCASVKKIRPKKEVGKEDVFIASELRWRVEEELAEQLHVPLDVTICVSNLLENDCTIPFIARYRKDVTGDMDATRLRHFADTLEHLKTVQSKARTMIECITKIDKMTPSLLTSFQHAKHLDELEHLYAPFKTNKKTLAERAKLLGLEPPAMDFLKNPYRFPVGFDKYIQSDKKGLSSLSEVETGIQHIIADHLAKDYTVLKYVKELFASDNLFLDSKISRKFGKTAQEENSHHRELNKYELYYDFKKRVSYIQPHQTLAINRGESAKVLTVKVDIPEHLKDKLYNFVFNYVCQNGRPSQEFNNRFLSTVIRDMYSRFIEPLVCRRARSDLTKAAEKSAVDVFKSNLRCLLLTAPLSGKAILALDPGFTNGCKLAAVAANGDVLQTETLYLHNRKCAYNDVGKLIDAVRRHRVSVIGIGNGTACRETESVVAGLIKDGSFAPYDVVYCIINESGVSVYSVSEEAVNEFPNMDPNHRSAVSLGRRLLDPLSEYVKVEPKHLGIGMYQHDISESMLKKSLDGVVEECVSFVGVDLNICSKTVLGKVAGLSLKKAETMIKWRQKNGSFMNREQIQLVPGIGPKTFEQCAGFLKIRKETLSNSNPEKVVELEDAKPKRKPSKLGKKGANVCSLNPLDTTIIHPESYSIVNRLVLDVGCELSDIGTPEFIKLMKNTLNDSKLENLSAEYKVGIATLKLIAEDLQKALNYDIRSEFSRPLFKQGIRDLDSLTSGMRMTGKVQNVVNFGVFVDIGVGQDALIHSSQLKDTVLCGYQLRNGDTVEVEVINVDRRKQRISLRLKALLESSQIALK